MFTEDYFTEEEIKFHRESIKRTALLYDRLIDLYWLKNIKVIRGGTKDDRVWFDQPNRISMMATCNNCGNTWKIRNENIFDIPDCPKCGSPIKNKFERPQGKIDQYSPELSIKRILEGGNIKYVEQVPLNNNTFPLTLDFSLPDYNYGIECQGEEHFSNSGIDAHRTTITEHNIIFLKQVIRDLEKWRIMKKHIFYYIPKNTGIENPVYTITKNIEQCINDLSLYDFNEVVKYAFRNNYLVGVPVLFENEKEKTLNVLIKCLKVMYSENNVFYGKDLLDKLK